MKSRYSFERIDARSTGARSEDGIFLLWGPGPGESITYTDADSRVQTDVTEYSPPLVGYALARAVRFQRLVEAWKSERGATSSITHMAMADSYQRIIAMGPSAVPLIIAQLKSEGEEPDQWFWALRVITGIDPVQAEHRGDFPKMARAWIGWAEAEDYAG